MPQLHQGFSDRTGLSDSWRMCFPGPLLEEELSCQPKGLASICYVSLLLPEGGWRCHQPSTLFSQMLLIQVNSYMNECKIPLHPHGTLLSWPWFPPQPPHPTLLLPSTTTSYLTECKARCIHMERYYLGLVSEQSNLVSESTVLVSESALLVSES